MVRYLVNPNINARPTLGTCKICGGTARLFDVVDFNKACNPGRDCYALGLSGIPVYYLRCTTCYFVFTDFFDDWSHETFSQYVYND